MKRPYNNPWSYPPDIDEFEIIVENFRRKYFEIEM